MVARFTRTTVLLVVVVVALFGGLVVIFSPQTTLKDVLPAGTKEAQPATARAAAAAETQRVNETNVPKTRASNADLSSSTLPPSERAPKINHRHQIGGMLNELNLKIGAEVGVQRGSFAYTTLENWNVCTKYYLIDVWAQQKNFNEPANVDDKTQLGIMQEAKETLKKWEDKLVWKRMTSLDAAKEIPDGSLDYVYIDARHDYCGVSEDLRAYWPKVHVGGIFAGHDFIDGTEGYIANTGRDYFTCMDGSKKPGAVKKAVHDFMEEMKIPASDLRLCEGDINDYPCWYMLKRF